MLQQITTSKKRPARKSAPQGIKRGILFFNRKHQPAAIAVRMALAEYRAAPHTQGYAPREVYFHPDECPEAAVITGLTVYTDRQIRPGHVRVTTNVVEYVEGL
ncbi:MAG: hypothetical protein BroJett011_62480 [Chloroflexota bacterium]|nr:MAG: hypothetical protein BroJett011_62480 [Chloroflexota bacterium]